jgi:hypothetical protein
MKEVVFSFSVSSSVWIDVIYKYLYVVYIMQCEVNRHLCILLVLFLTNVCQHYISGGRALFFLLKLNKFAMALPEQNIVKLM